MNVLEIAQAVCNELGLNAPTTLLTATDQQSRQILALLKRSGDELYQVAEWTQSQIQTIVNIGPALTITGNVVAGSTQITGLSSTAGLVANQFAVTGPGMMNSARVVGVVDPTTVAIDEPATGSFAGASFVFARDTFAIPADFSWFINRTMWDRTNQWELIGPVSPQADQWQRSGVVTTGPRRRWRQVGLPNTCWRIWPPPTASTDYPASLVYEYNSKWWVLSATGERKATISSDLDMTVVDPQALILAIKWRLWQIKGFSYGAMQAEYNDYVSRLTARDGGAPDLSLAPGSAQLLIGPESVPDGNWPGNN
jgi:hypothetical protein